MSDTEGQGCVTRRTAKVELEEYHTWVLGRVFLSRVGSIPEGTWCKSLTIYFSITTIYCGDIYTHAGTEMIIISIDPSRINSVQRMYLAGRLYSKMSNGHKGYFKF